MGGGAGGGGYAGSRAETESLLQWPEIPPVRMCVRRLCATSERTSSKTAAFGYLSPEKPGVDAQRDISSTVDKEGFQTTAANIKEAENILLGNIGQ